MPVKEAQSETHRFDRFTERARQVVVSAAGEARMVGANLIGTEHVLLGLLREEEGLGARVMGSLGVTDERVAARLGQTIIFGDQPVRGPWEFTPRADEALSLAVSEAETLGRDIAATHHVLLGLLRVAECTAVRVLLELAIPADQLRRHVIADVAAAPEEWPTSMQQLEAFRNRPRDDTAMRTRISNEVRLSHLRDQIEIAQVALQEATTDRQRFLAREDVDMLNSALELVLDTVA